MPPNPEKQQRLESMARLATSIRKLCDAAVSTGLPASAVDAIREQVDAATGAVSTLAGGNTTQRWVRNGLATAGGASTSRFLAGFECDIDCG